MLCMFIVLSCAPARHSNSDSGSAGGSTGPGGDNGTGGVPATGGSGDTGGSTAIGGSIGTGGATTAGGQSGTGGSTSAGGQSGAGGSTSTGGQSGTNLIANGDFSSGDTDWSSDVASLTHSTSTGAYCITVPSGQVVNIGWPNPPAVALNLPAGSGYTLSYQASSSGPLSITVSAKVGLSVSPYTADFQGATNTPGTSLQTYTESFSIANADTMAGLALIVTPAVSAGKTSNVCFDNVFLVPK